MTADPRDVILANCRDCLSDLLRGLLTLHSDLHDQKAARAVEALALTVSSYAAHLGHAHAQRLAQSIAAALDRPREMLRTDRACIRALLRAGALLWDMLTAAHTELAIQQRKETVKIVAELDLLFGDRLDSPTGIGSATRGTSGADRPGPYVQCIPKTISLHANRADSDSTNLIVELLRELECRDGSGFGVEAAPYAPPISEESAALCDSSVSVVTIARTRIDQLVDIVHDFALQQSMITQMISEDSRLSCDSPISIALHATDRLTRRIQEETLALGVRPIGALFRKLHPFIREVARAAGKSARIETEGDAIEIDTSIAQAAEWPLRELIRLAVEQGLETPSARQSAGKPVEGVVTLEARQLVGRILLNVSDDGHGTLHTHGEPWPPSSAAPPPISAGERVKAGMEQQCAGQPAPPPAPDVLDAIERAVRKMNGHMTFQSRPGAGSTTSVLLPLPMTVVDGMLVSVGEDVYVIPVASIIEVVRITSRIIRAVGATDRFICVRDELVPLLDLGAHMKLRDVQIDSGVAVVVEASQGCKSAILVDEVRDHRQVVTRRLENSHERIHCILAATILGNGKVGWILDIDELVAKPALH